MEKNFKKHNGFGNILDKIWKANIANKHLSKYNKLRNIFYTNKQVDIMKLFMVINNYKSCYILLTYKNIYEVYKQKYVR